MKNEYILPVSQRKTSLHVVHIAGKQHILIDEPVKEERVTDNRHVKQYETTVAGVFFFLVPVLFMFFCMLNFVRYEGYYEFITTLLLGGMLLRVVAGIWIAKVSKLQNRRCWSWVTFAFLLPGAALITIGQMKEARRAAKTQGETQF